MHRGAWRSARKGADVRCRQRLSAPGVAATAHWVRQGLGLPPSYGSSSGLNWRRRRSGRQGQFDHTTVDQAAPSLGGSISSVRAASYRRSKTTRSRQPLKLEGTCRSSRICLGLHCGEFRPSPAGQGETAVGAFPLCRLPCCAVVTGQLRPELLSRRGRKREPTRFIVLPPVGSARPPPRSQVSSASPASG
jgi:hypothetical protein